MAATKALLKFCTASHFFHTYLLISGLCGSKMHWFLVLLVFFKFCKMGSVTFAKLDIGFLDAKQLEKQRCELCPYHYLVTITNKNDYCVSNSS